MILGIDWGSSGIRAMRIGETGEVIEIRRAEDGVFTGLGAFETRLTRHLDGWLERFPTAPILMCGMIGSDRGWVQAPYVPAPCGMDDLAKALVRTPFARPSFIIPGVSQLAGETAEVMRGEETLIAGLLHRETIARATICLPGTHSKWVDVENGRIVRFRTYMTGELRAMAMSQGSLATGAQQQHSQEAFAKGADAAGRSVSNALFQARAQRLLGRLPEAHMASFVSGVLIGDEIAHETLSQPLFVVARGAIAADYQAALGSTPHRLVDPEPLAALGLHQLGSRAGLA